METINNNEVTITDITCKVIPDSRGKDTINVKVVAGNHEGSFSVPSGASTGAREVQVKPAEQANKIIQQTILPSLRGISIFEQAKIDAILRTLGETPDLATIGGNVALGVSVAACKTAAAARGVQTWEYIADLFNHQKQANNPRLFVNLINGGAHAAIGSDIQEHQIIPDTDDVAAGLEAAKTIQETLRQLLVETYGEEQIGIGDEGGFMIPSKTTNEPFQYIADAIAKSGVSIPILMGSDMAANSFYKQPNYNLNGANLTPEELLGTYQQLHQDFPLLKMVEDPCEETNFDTFAKYHANQPDVLTIGDDLTTTNISILQKAIDDDAINGIIIKPNQIGTISDTLDTMSLAYQNDIKCIVSHRSGETMDDFIADLAYGTKCYGLKAGAPSMPERAVKYDRLLAIQ